MVGNRVLDKRDNSPEVDDVSEIAWDVLKYPVSVIFLFFNMIFFIYLPLMIFLLVLNSKIYLKKNLIVFFFHIIKKLNIKV